MSFGIPATGWVLLFGLATLALPPLIHLLSRRRYIVVDWGAMQFLKLSQRRQRRILWEDLLLMLLRMAILAVFVVGLASPFLAGEWLAGLARRPARDIVLVVDRSASMAVELPGGDSIDTQVRHKITSFIDSLQPDDRIALVLAGSQVEIVSPGLTRNHRRIVERVGRLARPAGTCSGPEAIVQALELLQRQGQNDRKEVVVVTDGCRHGWSDPDSLPQWRRVAAWLEMSIDDSLPGTPFPRIWLLAAEEGKKTAGNLYLRGLRQGSRHIWAGKEAVFRLELVTQAGVSPDSWRLALAVDGKHVRYLPVPRTPSRSDGIIPIEFRHRFQEAGSHLLTLRLEPAPGRRRNPDHDCLSSDNESSLAVYVRERLRVLLVDGEERVGTDSSTYHLRRALSGKGATTARNVATVTVPHRRLTEQHLEGDRGSRPGVLFLADVPSLEDEQLDAIERFIAEGGGVCVFIGKRVTDPDFYNERLWRFGTGWLPGRLLAPNGDVMQPQEAARPDLLSFQHPALDLFLHTENCTLDKARFPRYWRVSTAGTEGATVAATLNNGDPLLIERRYNRGKVLLCTVPLDAAWGSSFIRVWEYPVFVHEIAYYLADAEPVQCNSDVGEPLRWNPTALGMNIDLPTTVTVEAPDGDTLRIEASRLPLTIDAVRNPGVYTLTTDGSPPTYHVVRPDWRESELGRMTEADRKTIATKLTLAIEDGAGGNVEYQAIRFVASPEGILSASADAATRLELWPWLLAFVIALLIVEVWLTRRLAKRSGV